MWLGTFALLAAMVFRSASAQDSLVFERHVRPIFKTYCLDCHGGGETLNGNLDLRLRRLVEKGGDSGPALLVGKGAASLLVQRLRAGEMPPGEKKLTAEQIGLIEKWIDGGALTSRTEPEQLPQGIDITPEERSHWAYQPIVRREPPSFEAADRVRTPIDAWILARLRENGLSFSPDADRITLVRRLAFDLTGLPPTAEELGRFLLDDSEAGYAAVVQYYLDSPHYGEHWGRHWLDVAGYAESEGNGSDDTLRPYAHKYRDYVIRAFNTDKPFDRFVLEQLAGDELVPLPWNNLNAEQVELLAATGFARMGPDATATGGDDLLVQNQVVADSIKILGSSLLGLTVGCAQCHDHRYDPIPQQDYFRLRAILEPSLDPSHWRRPGQRLISLYSDADRAKAAAVETEAQALQKELDAKADKYVAEAFDKELTKFPDDQRETLRVAFQTPDAQRTAEQNQLVATNPSLKINRGVLYQYNQAAADELKKEQEKVNAKRGEKPVEDFVSVLNELPGVLPPTHLHYRGDPRQPKQPVLPGDLTIAAAEGTRFEIPEKDPAQPTSGRRANWARHLMSGKHPLTGRVLVNRVWMHHFGRGIVESAGDFGTLGSQPSHPELLDWLADEWVKQEWSLKRLHRLIVSSTVYRQSSARNAAQDRSDADNRLLGHFPLQRLEAECVRDRMLSISGSLDRGMLGPSVPVEEDMVGQVVPKGESTRRSIYLQVRRSKPTSFLTAFDAPVMSVNCERRSISTVAPQSLMLMNSEFVLKQAELLAKRVAQEIPHDFRAAECRGWSERIGYFPNFWSYGYGFLDESSQRVSTFEALPHWTGTAWQGGAVLPDSRIGWAIVHASGGHAGNDVQHAAIRRWTAPRAGTLQIRGTLRHPSENGNGVRGRIVSSRSGVAGSWNVKNAENATQIDRLDLQRGDTVDFVIDCLEDVNSDSFEWRVQLQLFDDQGTVVSQSDSLDDFSGPRGANVAQRVAWLWQLAYHRQPSSEEWEAVADFLSSRIAELRLAVHKEPETTAFTDLCQQVLSSNEFLYVD
ncbi:MAG: DUF1553 domain-containing protein [Planctomycetes bacterium]|nr:DUF1553 domain-containing protein [Planctomycetota bacterium]